ncbi:Adenosylcobinamide-phosphate synthase [invertebrate metagenome]|uniref:Adenosylcobinamide-phosphate synthase n=1 Tax=invertebrate metagenome TaxID=1711999 RepID=A0A484H7H0_9ZZZZ
MPIAAHTRRRKTADGTLVVFSSCSTLGLYCPNLLLLLLAGLLLDAVAGEMPWLRVPHPVVVIGWAVAALEGVLNHPWYDSAARRRRGAFTVVVTVGAATTVGIGGHGLAMMIPYAWGLEVFLIGILIAQRSLYQHVVAVAHGLAHGGLQGGRLSVARICGRNPSRLSESGVVRSAIESCAENFNDGVVAPVFWYGLCGLPGLLVYKTVNTLDSMIGHYNERYRAFGYTAARLDDLLNWVPSRLAGLLLVGAAIFVPTAQPWRAFVTMIQDARKHRSPNAGWPEAAMAGALGLALAGPRCYLEYRVADAWIGASGRKEAEVRDIFRALGLFVLACVLNTMMVFLVWSSLL